MVPRPNVLSGILAVVLAITLHYLYEVYEASLQSGQDCSYASGDACPVDSLKISDTDGSALIYPGGETRCAFDDFTDPKTGFSTNSTYFFQVFPKPERKKLLIMFQGGGGCFDDTACNFAMQCSLGTSTFTTVATASNTGVFNSSDPENVFKDWNIVHIPYCTGDMHSGSKVVDGVDTGHEGVFNHAQCLNQNMPLHLNGFENSKAALAWAKTNYPEVDELVVSGMSAGSMAAQTWAIYIADLWNVPSSETRYGILADSCMGVLPAEYPVGKMFDYVGMCDLDLKLPPSVVDACKAGTLTMNEIVSASLKALPESRWAFLNSKSDGDQRFFYQFIKDGILGFPFPDILPEADFHEVRYACQQINRNWLCGHMFALYFEKETAGSAHPHDFHYVVIWTMGLTVTHATAFSKGKPLTKPYMSTDVAKELNRVKFVFHEEGSSRHALRFADPSGDKTAENENGYFVLPAVVSWHTMQGEAGIDNRKMIEKMNALGFENVPNPMADEHFLKNMNAGRPAEYPELNEVSLKVSL